MFPQLESEQSLNGHIKMADQESSVREFVAVTDVDEERARFFLESAGWDLQVHADHIDLPVVLHVIFEVNSQQHTNGSV